MLLKKLPYDLTVCRVKSMAEIDLDAGFFFIGKTDEELSLVCETRDAPGCATEREDGWRGIRVEGTLDFSLIGILAGITAVLAEAGISVFAVSTYNTDYILVKEESYDRALSALERAGHVFA